MQVKRSYPAGGQINRH